MKISGQIPFFLGKTKPNKTPKAT